MQRRPSLFSFNNNISWFTEWYALRKSTKRTYVMICLSRLTWTAEKKLMHADNVPDFGWYMRNEIFQILPCFWISLQNWWCRYNSSENFWLHDQYWNWSIVSCCWVHTLKNWNDHCLAFLFCCWSWRANYSCNSSIGFQYFMLWNFELLHGLITIDITELNFSFRFQLSITRL